MTSENTEKLVNRYVDSVLQSESLEEAFNSFIIHSAGQEKWKMKAYEDGLKNLFSNLPHDSIESAVKQYVKDVSELSSQRQATLLLSMLEFGVSSNLLSPKLVCETLLTCEKLQYQNEHFWLQTFQLVRRIISGVDYKGVRDLLKIILGKAHTSIIPSNINVSVLNQLNALQQVMEHIFDRNASLLPSYLVLDEVQKRLCPKGGWPHWKFSKLISSFIDSFQPTAQMVSVTLFYSTPGRSMLLPVVGHSVGLGHVWKLDPTTAKFSLRGCLPFRKDLLIPQTALLQYVLEQPYSREMVCAMLGLSKQHKQSCQALEEQLVELLLVAMERSENEADSNEDWTSTQLLWQHLSCQLIYFVLFQYTSFPQMVLSLHDKLAGRNLKKGRDHLMWVLLQFISGSIQKHPLNDFLPVLKLYDLLYPEKEPLPLPDVTKASATHSLAITSIWIHLMKRVQTDKVNLQRPVPQALKTHLEFLQRSLMSTDLPISLNTNYTVSLLCNAYSTNQDYFSRPMGVLVEAVYGNQKSQQAALNTSSSTVLGPVQPLSMIVLDSLTVHTKMSLIHNIMSHIVTHVVKQVQSKTSTPLAPALVETYSRLLVYNEIESLGIKGFITHLLVNVLRHQAWGTLHTLLEMFTYRLHHILPHYRIHLLTHLQNLATLPQTNQIQLFLCMESTALKLIMRLGNAEVQPQLSRFQSENRNQPVISAESEELNKALVLTLARAIHVTGSETLSATWCKDLLSNIMQNTPLSWSNFTLMCFPPVLADFFTQYQVQKENKAQLKRSVEEEYRKWKTMSNENDIIAHFSLQKTTPLFLCLLWKMLLENDRISPLAYKILDRIGARALSAHLRTFADFLVFEFANSPGGQYVNRYIDALNNLIWKCHVITLDRLILCLALRSFEGNEAQVCFFIIHMLLLRPEEFKNRVYDFVKDNSPEHWKQTNWHENHVMFQRKYPEKFYFEGLQDMSGQGSQHIYHPVYFGNVCLRFLPVMDIVIHRFLELAPVAPVSMSVEGLLDQLGCLYKFHDHPVTYLYNTLHYYEQKLKDRSTLKRKLVSSIIGSLKDIRPRDWALTEDFLAYAQRPSEDINWMPELDYYVRLMERLVNTINGKHVFPHMDWRFNEFPNPAAHALHITGVEIMALPVSASTVGSNLLDVVLKGHAVLPRANISSWMNAVGLTLTALPESYWSALHNKILEMIQNPLLSSPSPTLDVFQVFDFSSNHESMCEIQCSYLVALTHAVWYHASIGQMSVLPQFIKDQVKPVITNEEQFLFLCHLVGPFLQRLWSERTRIVMDLTLELYQILQKVDQSCEHLNHLVPICDLLYHIKYMFTGDSIKNDIEGIIRTLRPSLQKQLRFITHLNIEEPALT